MSRPRIALVVPGLEAGGGVPVVALFLCDVLERSGRYEPSLVSVPMASRDASSVRLLSPASWTRGITQRSGVYRERPFEHVGSFLAELEFQRYKTRPLLDRLLDTHDVVQVVAGCPGWLMVAENTPRPLGLQVATMTVAERASVTAATSGARRMLHRVMTGVLTRLERRALERADRIFVENDLMLETAGRIAGAERVVMAPPGIDTELFTPRARQPDDGFILSVGRLSDPRKNVAMLFRAYAELLRLLPDAPLLLLAGHTGPADADWSLAESLGIRARVEFRRDVPFAELIELYRGAGVYALSSNEEGLGLVILEAMACGTAVVSTDCGGPTTSIVEGETGFITPVGDHVAFAERLRQVLVDPERTARMGISARERAASAFSIEAAGRPFVAWYDEVTAGGGSSIDSACC